jgi:uncharacterized membrane protein YcaP (DUF421 family)
MPDRAREFEKSTGTGASPPRLSLGMEWLTELFGTTAQVSALQECARAVLIFAYGLLLIRLAGRRVFGRWSALDIIVSIVVGSNLSRALTGSAPLFGTMLATALLMLLHWVLAYLAARWRSVSRILEGTPIVLSEESRFSEEAQRRHAISEADLNEALRQSGLEDIGDAHRITLEPSGRLTVIKRK